MIFKFLPNCKYYYTIYMIYHSFYTTCLNFSMLLVACMTKSVGSQNWNDAMIIINTYTVKICNILSSVQWKLSPILFVISPACARILSVLAHNIDKELVNQPGRNMYAVQTVMSSAVIIVILNSFLSHGSRQ